ncbi:hypothetical protein [Cyclobacterium marinum]|nr:hypothetical protein [Cyclobacterium marinum]
MNRYLMMVKITLLLNCIGNSKKIQMNEAQIKIIRKAKSIVKNGDRVRCRKCPGTLRTFTFSHWDVCWMVSKSGIDDYSPLSIDKINGKEIHLKK